MPRATTHPHNSSGANSELPWKRDDACLWPSYPCPLVLSLISASGLGPSKGEGRGGGGFSMSYCDTSSPGSPEAPKRFRPGGSKRAGAKREWTGTTLESRIPAFPLSSHHFSPSFALPPCPLILVFYNTPTPRPDRKVKGREERERVSAREPEYNRTQYDPERERCEY